MVLVIFIHAKRKSNSDDKPAKKIPRSVGRGSFAAGRGSHIFQGGMASDDRTIVDRPPVRGNDFCEPADAAIGRGDVVRGNIPSLEAIPIFGSTGFNKADRSV